jgi:uncharacterized membrane protein YedE/YeeE
MEWVDSLFPLGMGHYLAGGLVIGVAVSLLYVSTGLIGGMSTFYSSIWSYVSKSAFFQRPDNLDSRHWRLVYAVGLVLGAAFWVYGLDNSSPVTTLSWQKLVIGGFIAGFGARLGNGCTSGHGICGMASLSWLSFIAVAVFLTVAIVTAHIMQALGS